MNKRDGAATSGQRGGSRRWRPGIVGIALLVPVAACATNPLNGKDNLVLVSDEQEIEIGKSAIAQVASSVGVYENPALTAYVARVGKALAAKSERPDLPWEFQVVDDPTVNAFTLGGGPIFVHRGLLAHLSSEAQLASVLGHEIGHVTGRHAIRQMSKEMLFVLGAEVGKEIWGGWSDVESLLSPAVGLLMLRYGRDDEREADDLGYRYTVANGYEVREAPGIFRMFKRIAEVDGGGTLPVWLSSHPESGARADHFTKVIEAAAPPAGNVGRDEFFAVINNLVFGPDPRQGYFEGGVFKHPRRKFQITPPAGWNANIVERALVITPVEGEAGMKFGETTEGGTPAEALQTYLSREDMTKGEPFVMGPGMFHNGARFIREDEEGNKQHGAVVFFSHDGAVIKAAFGAPAKDLGAVEATFRRTLESWKVLSDPAALAVEPARLKLVDVPQVTTLAELAKIHPAIPLARLAIMNQLEPDARLAAGQKIKVVEGRVRDDQIKAKS
jgi:predicted Zn-dependent protease